MESLLHDLITLLVGGLLGYFISYTKEKGKNRALKEDMAALEDAKQKVQRKYTARLEDIKKQHALDVELRKHKYQDKREQFAKYFGLLDEFHGKSNALFTESFPPIFKEFFAGYLQEDEGAKNKAICDFNDSMQLLFNELNQEHLKLGTETNSIRLISSEEMDSLLDTLEAEVASATNLAQEMMRIMATPEFWADQSILEPYKRRLVESGEVIKSVRNDIRKQMKVELGEI